MTRQIKIGGKVYNFGEKRELVAGPSSNKGDEVTINYDGEKVTVPRNISNVELKKILKTPDDKFLTRQNQSGVSEVITGKVSLNEGDALLSSSNYTKYDTDYNRLKKDIYDLAELFSIEFETDEMNYMKIEGYGLPNIYNHKETDIVLNVENYPAVHPASDHYVWMREGLRVYGKKDPHYLEGNSNFSKMFFGKKWVAFCAGKLSGWNPRTDNFFTYLATLDVMLSNPAAKGVQNKR